MRPDDARACAWLQAIRYVVNQMDRYLLAQREYRTGFMVRIKHFIAKLCCLVGGKLYGNYLISGYPPPAIRRSAIRRPGRCSQRCNQDRCCEIREQQRRLFLISGYMAVKLLYVANAVSMLFLLDSFLRIDYPMYGLRVVEQLIRGQDWG